MLTYSFEGRHGESLYDYLYNCIKTDIVNHKLSAYEKLPSKRVFASVHGISIATVEAAYGQLVAEGYIYSKPSSGYFVSPIEYYGKEKVTRIFEKEDKDYAVEGHSTGNVNAVTPMSQNAQHFPFSIWAKISRRLLSQKDAKLLTVPPAGGVMELREAITKHLYDFRGIKVNPQQVIIGAGTEYLYGLIVQLFGREKSYGLENPCSRKIRNIYRSLGANVTLLPMDSEGVVLDSQELNTSDIIQISPSHQFPTGVVSPASRRYALLRWAGEKEDRFIIEDDYDSEFRMQGKPIPALFSMDNMGKVIYFNTFTKTLTATIRISYMVLPENMLERFYEKLGFYACTVSNFEQYTLAAFIEEKHFEKHINRMRNRYRLLRLEFEKGIKESGLSSFVTIMEEDAGLHFLLKINIRKSDSELKEMAAKEGVVIDFVSEYYETTDNNIPAMHMHTAIIGYNILSDKGAKETVTALLRAWSALQ